MGGVFYDKDKIIDMIWFIMKCNIYKYGGVDVFLVIMCVMLGLCGVC